MDPDDINEKPDMTLSFLAKQDLYEMSVDDLKDRIAAMRAEITRCEAALGDRDSSRSEAEKLFKS